jgi:hypothetical protein
MFTNLPETPCGYLTTSSPGATTSRTKERAAAVAPHAEMDARLFDGRREPREPVGRECQVRLEGQRSHRSRRRKKGERDRGRVAFLAAKAGPERGADDRFDRVEVRLRRKVRLAALARHLRGGYDGSVIVGPFSL